MSRLSKQETIDKLCVILRIIYEACMPNNPIKGGLSKTIKELDNTMPYYSTIPTILKEKGIMRMENIKGKNGVLWFWVSTTEPNRHMCEAILNAIKQKYTKVADETCSMSLSVFNSKSTETSSVEERVQKKILEVSNRLNALTKELEALKEEETLLEHETASLHFYLTELQSLLD